MTSQIFRFMLSEFSIFYQEFACLHRCNIQKFFLPRILSLSYFFHNVMNITICKLVYFTKLTEVFWIQKTNVSMKFISLFLAAFRDFHFLHQRHPPQPVDCNVLVHVQQDPGFQHSGLQVPEIRAAD